MMASPCNPSLLSPTPRRYTLTIGADVQDAEKTATAMAEARAAVTARVRVRIGKRRDDTTQREHDNH